MAEILTKADKDRIEGALKAIADVKKEIYKAKQAGIDMAEQEKRLLESETKLQAIKRTYFPA